MQKPQATPDVINKYNKADNSGRKLLEEIFGKEPFESKMPTYEEACKQQGISPLKLSDFNFLPEEDREYHFCDHQLTVLARSVRGDWEPDWDNSGQPKWYPWFNMGSSGFGFSYYGGDDRATFSRSGSRLCFPTEKMAEEFAKSYIDLYKKTMLLKLKEL